MKRIKIIGFILVFLWLTLNSYADTLTLQRCIDMALERSVLSQQQLYNESIRVLEEKTALSYRMPQLHLQGQAHYQSDVVQFSGNPVFELPDIPKDQYKAYVEVMQPLYAGGSIGIKSRLTTMENEIGRKAMEVDLYKVKEAVTALYFGILLTEKQASLLKSTLEELDRQYQLMVSREKHGVVQRNFLDQFALQIKKVNGQLLEINYKWQSLQAMLSSWTGITLTSDTMLQVPGFSEDRGEEVVRPEVEILNVRVSYMETLTGIQQAAKKPNLVLFGQGGVGRPNPFNFFETGTAGFYIVGLRLNWNIYDYGRVKRALEITRLKQQNLMTKRDFLSENFSRDYRQNDLETKKYMALYNNTKESIELQEQIVKRVKSQLDNGVATTTDYLQEMNTLLQLRLQMEIQDVQRYHYYYKSQLSLGTL
ncbi:MAG: TolC family protein [Cyclobacteriaceae bacterium]|nr:TolC family protein [Cyclobacteriaceae bacterium]